MSDPGRRLHLFMFIQSPLHAHTPNQRIINPGAALPLDPGLQKGHRTAGPPAAPLAHRVRPGASCVCVSRSLSCSSRCRVSVDVAPLHVCVVGLTTPIRLHPYPYIPTSKTKPGHPQQLPADPRQDHQEPRPAAAGGQGPGPPQLLQHGLLSV